MASTSTVTGTLPPTPSRPSSGNRLPRGLAAFRHRNYRLFWFGQAISLTGTWMQTLAQSWLVVDNLHGSAFQLGLVSIFQFAPALVLGLVGGVVADRVPKRTLIVVTQTLFALLAGILALLVASGRVQLWHVYALALAFGVVNTFDLPTRQAFVPEMVGKADLMNAVALNSALFNAARVIGPAVAGVLLALFGPAICFGLNAASYLAVIAGLLMMRLGPRVKARHGRGIAEIREGLSYVRATPSVLLPIVLVGFVATFGMNFNVWIPLLAKHNFGSGADGFGLLLAAMGVGSFFGAAGLAFFGRRPHRGVMLGAAAALGALEVLLGVAGAIPLSIAVAMLLLAGIGFASSSTMAMANTTVQTYAPDELRGRVMSVYTTVFTGTAPLGALVAGGLAGWFGAPSSVAVGGIIALAAAIAVTIWRQRAAYHRGPGVGTQVPPIGDERAAAPAPAAARLGPAPGPQQPAPGPRPHSPDPRRQHAAEAQLED